MRGLCRYTILRSDLIGYKSQADKGNVKLLQGSLTWPSAKTRLRLNFQGRATLTTPAPIAYSSTAHPTLSSSGVNQYTGLTGPLSCVKAQSTVLLLAISRFAVLASLPALSRPPNVEPGSYGCRSQNHHRALLCRYLLESDNRHH